MARLVLVCGPIGVGKTTYSLALAEEIGGIRFSIDPWMQTLFGEDMVTLDFNWMMERVNRCCEQIWQVSEQILAINGHVILDLGFTTKEQRDIFVNRATQMNVQSEIHFLDAPLETRKRRVDQRNIEKDPSVFSFEVTATMFDFMEPRFEVPNRQELENGCKVHT